MKISTLFWGVSAAWAVALSPAFPQSGATDAEAALKAAVTQHGFQYLGAPTTGGSPGDIYVKVKDASGQTNPRLLCSLFTNAPTVSATSTWPSANIKQTTNFNFLASLLAAVKAITDASANINWSNVHYYSVNWGSITTATLPLGNLTEAHQAALGHGTYTGGINQSCFTTVDALIAKKQTVLLMQQVASASSLTVNASINEALSEGNSIPTNNTEGCTEVSGTNVILTNAPGCTSGGVGITISKIVNLQLAAGVQAIGGSELAFTTPLNVGFVLLDVKNLQQSGLESAIGQAQINFRRATAVSLRNPVGALSAAKYTAARDAVGGP